MALSGIGVTKELLAWIESLADRGAFVAAPDGSGGFEPKVDELIRAIHASLAGGDVAVTIRVPGDPALKQDLDDKLDAALGAASVPSGTLSTFLP